MWECWTGHVVCIGRLELLIVGEELRSPAQEELMSQHLSTCWSEDPHLSSSISGEIICFSEWTNSCEIRDHVFQDHCG